MHAESEFMRLAQAHPLKHPKLRQALVFLLAGWSGFYVMAVELLSGRLIAPTFGNSIYVWGGIITVFMLALSLGYLLGGQFSLQRPSLRRLGVILIVAGLSTLPVVALGDPILNWLFDHIADPRYGTLAASTALFFVPTVISGMVSPYAIRLLVRQLAQSGKSAGRLYFVSTFGSAAGTLMTSFYLVLWFELTQIYLGLIAVSVLLGIAALPFGEVVHDKEAGHA
ncbi:fused MFS/spermidine synthase [Chitinimonas sp. BJYL2]|uniref:fused MFS/spermidine synthase n=1 Tax=Chitinimonas sp. BJYL2 TaxID=2976696 RepID=UPI0022B35187|nr:fused MFS/spermidine synthase [Chitinimonas sp. BJYL2]